MEDKQIITKDVDTRGCKFFRQGICASPINPKCKLCVEISEKMCYYKQLKSKEQECEELRQYHNKCCEENAKKLKEWLEKYNQVSQDFYSGKYCNKEKCSLLQAKEQECEELKKKCNIYTCGICGNKEDCNKIYKTLTEIKEITEYCMKQDICTTCDYSDKCYIEDEEIPTYDVCKLILQKISECEVE